MSRKKERRERTKRRERERERERKREGGREENAVFIGGIWTNQATRDVILGIG